MMLSQKMKPCKNSKNWKVSSQKWRKSFSLGAEADRGVFRFDNLVNGKPDTVFLGPSCLGMLPWCIIPLIVPARKHLADYVLCPAQEPRFLILVAKELREYGDKATQKPTMTCVCKRHHPCSRFQICAMVFFFKGCCAKSGCLHLLVCCLPARPSSRSAKQGFASASRWAWHPFGLGQQCNIPWRAARHRESSKAPPGRHWTRTPHLSNPQISHMNGVWSRGYSGETYAIFHVANKEWYIAPKEKIGNNTAVFSAGEAASYAFEKWGSGTPKTYNGICFANEPPQKSVEFKISKEFNGTPAGSKNSEKNVYASSTTKNRNTRPRAIRRMWGTFFMFHSTRLIENPF